MDRIGSNPLFNPTNLYQQNQASRANASVETEVGKATNLSRAAVPEAQATSGFSNMFADDELSKLQGNLEAIANLAERALKRIEG